MSKETAGKLAYIQGAVEVKYTVLEVARMLKNIWLLKIDIE